MPSDPLPPGVGSGPPEARPRPTLEQVQAAAGGSYDEAEFRALADAQPSTDAGGTSATIGEHGGEQFVDFIYGDVSNYAGVAAFADDEILVRVVRRVGVNPGGDYRFQVVHISAATRTVGNIGVLSQSQRPATWIWDSPDTPWAD